MTKKKKVFLWGYYGANNVGDDLLLSLLLKTLLKYKVQIEVIVAEKYEKYKVLDNVNFITIPTNKPWYKLLFLRNMILYIKMIKNNDIIIFGGGTSLFETDNTKYKSLLIKYIIFLWNRIFFKRLILHIGVGIGNVQTKIGKFCLKNILNLSYTINFREEKSYQKALSMIKNKNKFSLGNDMAYLFSFTPKQETKTYNIGLSLFQYYGYISKDVAKIKDFNDCCINLIKEILKKDNRIQIFLFGLQKKRGGFDEEYSFQLKNEIENSRLYVCPYDSNTDAFIEEIKKMDFCIGMRLHFLIISLLSGIPIVGLNYQPKVRNELLSLGLESYCYEMNKILDVLPIISNFIHQKELFLRQYEYIFHRVKEKNKKTEEQINQMLYKALENKYD
jgi:polysaccharide pyruvyl transferase WcaK-like protein